jgi:Rrf2 family protein
MMKISTKTEYGIRCLLRLAREQGGESLSISQISQMEHVPKHYAHQILLRLGRAGLVKSTRGTEGGFALAQPPASITVAQVVSVLEGVPFKDTCDQFNKHTDCGHQHSDCSIRPVWQVIGRRLWETLEQINLLQLLDDEKTVGKKLELDIPAMRFNV